MLLRKIGRPIVQKTAARERGRPLLVDLQLGYMVLRLTGTRHRWPISYKSVVSSAVKGAAEKQREDHDEATEEAALKDRNIRERQIVDGVH